MMTRNACELAVCAVVLALCVGCAQSAPARQRRHVRDEGYVVTDEDLDALKMVFDLMDVNGDGRMTIDEAELMGMDRGQLEKDWVLIDGDMNGSLTFPEILAGIYHIMEVSEPEITPVKRRLYRTSRGRLTRYGRR